MDFLYNGMPNHMTALTDFLIPSEQIAREAGALLLSYFPSSAGRKPATASVPHGERLEVHSKGEADLVTTADRRSEALITERIRELWPDHSIVGEEGTRQESESGYRWFVDPLDGTTNFAHGYPTFSVSIALERRGEILCGVVFDPMRDELFSATAGGGARLNGETIRVSEVSKLSQSLVATGFPGQGRHADPNIRFYYHVMMRSHDVRRDGSAAIDLAAVACGRLEAFWEFNLKPWDTAAGALLVREAGGQISNFSGGTFDLHGSEVCASNARIHNELIEQFNIVFAQKAEAPPWPAGYRR